MRDQLLLTTDTSYFQVTFPRLAAAGDVDRVKAPETTLMVTS